MYYYKTYSIYLIFTVISFFIIIYSISALCFLYKPLYTEAEYWIPEIYSIKDKYAQNLKGQKIIIASGSNSLFGIHSDLLAEKTGYNVLNLAVHAALPLEFLSYKIKEYATEGDIVILPLEYGYYFRDEQPSKWVIQNFTTWGYQYLHIFPKNAFTEIVYKSLLSYPKRLPYFYKNFPVRNMDNITINNKNKFLSKIGYIADASTTSGEFLIDLPTTEKILKEEPEYINNNCISEYFLQLISNLKKDLAQKRVKLYLSYPCTIKNKNFNLNNQNHLSKLNVIFHELEKYGIETIGNPLLYNMNKKNFYDTTYHLNAFGNIVRTLFLADDFNNKINNIEGNSNIDIYLAQKEAEATAILRQYRLLGYIKE